MGACSWAPAIQVNYDFHHYVTPEKLDQLLDDVRRANRQKASIMMLYNEPSPLEVKVLTQRFGLPNSALHRHLSRERRLQGVQEGRSDDAGARSSKK